MKVFFSIALLLSTLYAQADLDSLGDDVLLNRAILAAAVSDELRGQQDPVSIMTQQPTKSVPMAVLFSVGLPGAGQFYAESYWKSALFFVIEASAITVNRIYNGKGDDATDDHRAHVDQYWSEQYYWSYVYQQVNNQEFITGFPDGIYDADVYLETIDYWRGGTQDIPLLADWEEKRELLDEYDDELSGFTHHLPETKTQQYYEMVGKYPRQFGYGWADAGFTDAYTGYDSPGSPRLLSPLNETSEDLRSELNRFYDIAGYGSMTILINHLVSAVDAGFTARGFNLRQSRLAFENRRINGEYVNMYGLVVNW